MFYKALFKFSDNVALIHKQQKLSYKDLDEACRDFSEQLSGAGGLGFIYCKNDMATCIAYLSCLQQKLPVLLLDGDISDDMSKQLKASYLPNFVIQNGQITFYDNTSLGVDSRVAILLSTSGSTGSPKQVALSGINLHSNATAIAEYLKITSTDIAITSLPMNYSYGLSVLNSHLASGAAIVLTDESIISRPFWQAFEEHQVTSLAGVPHSYQMLLRLGFTKKQYGHLKCLTQAGGKLDKNSILALADYAHQNAINFYIMYGQTEATARIAYLDAKKVSEKPDSIGKAIPGGNLYLTDLESGSQINTPGITGELVYKGDNVMLGYANSRQDLNCMKSLTLLKTGDIAYCDEEGDFFVTGRLKRIVKIVGKRTSLDEVEHLLEEQGLVAKVIGDDERLNIVSPEILPANLAVELGKTLGLHASFIHCYEGVEIPTNENGKTDYVSLQIKVQGMNN